MTATAMDVVDTGPAAEAGPERESRPPEPAAGRPGWPSPAEDAATRASKLARAGAHGRAAADLIQDPSAFVAAVHRAFDDLSEEEYRAGQAFVAPGIGVTHGVRLPYQSALRRAVAKGTRRDSASTLLFVADQLLRQPELEERWLGLALLERTVLSEPERSWQLLRRAAADASDWITVDTLAHPVGRGILQQPHRWEELEQLTISPSCWERRLVGSTVATIPSVDRSRGRSPEVVEHGLALLGLLIGDDEPDVQKALAWAYRSMAMVDAATTIGALDAEAATARETRDGHRAWVIRDALPKLSPLDAARIRATLDGLRRRPGAPASSRASELASRFAGMGLGRAMPERPLR